MRAHRLFTATAFLGLVIAKIGADRRADFGVDWNEADFSKEGVFLLGEPATFLESFQGVEKNDTQQRLRDRSAELYARQQCNAGYGYCANLGGCCPSSNKCCGYGYCLEPGKTCCPGGSCGAGLTCCENKCMPEGASCCRGGNYCEAGNMCVLYDGRGVCCTDLQCTAVVTGGSTSFARTTTRASPATITQPPRTTQVIVDIFTTYYWTVRWRYYSYYWTIFQARSTVTYTMTTYTTIYTTTASDDRQASALFADLSKTLTFSTPAEATTLASFLDASPSPTATTTTALDTELGSSAVAGPTSQDINLDSPGDDSTTPGATAARTSSSRTSIRTAASSSAPAAGGGASAADSIGVQMILALAVLSGILMVLL